MKSRSRRSSSKPPERARSPAGGAAQKCDTTVQQRRQRTRAQMAAGRRPLFAKNTPYARIRRAGNRKWTHQSKAVFRPEPADRPLESGAAGKRARPPIRPACAGLPRTKAHGFSAVLTNNRKAGRPSGGTVLLLHLSGGPSASERICARAQQSAFASFCDARRAEQSKSIQDIRAEAQLSINSFGSGSVPSARVYA